MSDTQTPIVVLSTSIVALLTGFMLGIYSIRGYIISPSLAAERAANYTDPVESDESDVDEDDTILDHAPNWANAEDADRRQGLRADGPKESTKTSSKKSSSKKSFAAVAASAPVAAADPKITEECKLVLVVRTDLGMTKGKIAAQCGHATLACYKELLSASQQKDGGPEAANARAVLRQWEHHGQAKIALQIKSQDEMLELMGKARSLGVTAEVIADAGRTQIDPGSLTVLGVGPAPKSLINQITGHLKLL
ncbi:peptidyl-tRNA hydrolase PTH2-domain-containing protein [Bombardia bombarda]|uniref:peptidyl-tRNA hydrolase n=1 Tax=Bombardia bombarda TaxID=252184 RepID=A0AA39XIK9_9PEZI|nr:peptidyl-tRNA hydrolase PTH2-domain-containing protein [Bombardia bombarda]